VDTLARRALHIYGCAARQQHSVKTRQAVEALAR